MNTPAPTTAPTGRELTIVGWDGRSNPMLRYTDELTLPDYARSIVSEADRVVEAVERAERGRRAAERGRMTARSQALNAAARAGDAAERHKVMYGGG